MVMNSILHKDPVMIVKSKLKAVQAHEPIHITILRRCLQFHNEDPEKKAYFSSIDNSDGVTFKQIYDYSLNLGSWFLENGFRKGDVLLLCMYNSWHFVVTCLGAWSAGLVVSPASTLFTEYELRYQLEDSTAKIIVTEESLLEKVTKANSNGAKILCVSEKSTGANDFMNIVTKQNVSARVPVPIDLVNDLILLSYSSGTTGAPKGVMLSHRNYAAALISYVIKFDDSYKALGLDGFVPPAHLMAFLPQYHAMGLFGTIFALHNGTTQITMKKFNLELLLKHLQDYNISSLGAVPSVVLAMAESPILDNYDLSSLMMIATGGAPLSLKVVERLQKRLPHVQLFQGYGMTEMSIASHISSLGCPDGSVGQLLPNTEMKVISKTGKLCGPREQGELWVRGPQVMKGYWRRPELSKDLFDSEGFMRTGDIVYYDENGYTFICDRAKELIKVHGKQVSPTELEDVLLAHPEITDCCVVGIPDDNYGEVPLAFVVAKSINKEGIHAYMKERLAPYKRLRGGIRFLDAIPRTPSGKTMKRFLKDHYLKTVKQTHKSRL